MAAAGLAARDGSMVSAPRMSGRRACARFDYMMMRIPSSNNRTDSFSSNHRHNKHQRTPHTTTIPHSRASGGWTAAGPRATVCCPGPSAHWPAKVANSTTRCFLGSAKVLVKNANEIPLAGSAHLPPRAVQGWTSSTEAMWCGGWRGLYVTARAVAMVHTAWCIPGLATGTVVPERGVRVGVAEAAAKHLARGEPCHPLGGSAHPVHLPSTR